MSSFYFLFCELQCITWAMISVLYVLFAQSNEDTLLNLFKYVQHHFVETGWATSYHSTVLTDQLSISWRYHTYMYYLCDIYEALYSNRQLQCQMLKQLKINVKGCVNSSGRTFISWQSVQVLTSYHMFWLLAQEIWYNQHIVMLKGVQEWSQKNLVSLT